MRPGTPLSELIPTTANFGIRKVYDAGRPPLFAFPGYYQEVQYGYCAPGNRRRSVDREHHRLGCADAARLVVVADV
jgi:hypothetical protein